MIIGLQKPPSSLMFHSRIPLFIGFIGFFFIYIRDAYSPPTPICASRIPHPHTYIIYISRKKPDFSYNWSKTLIFQHFLASKTVFSFPYFLAFPIIFIVLYCLRCFFCIVCVVFCIGFYCLILFLLPVIFKIKIDRRPFVLF